MVSDLEYLLRKEIEQKDKIIKQLKALVKSLEKQLGIERKRKA